MRSADSSCEKPMGVTDVENHDASAHVSTPLRAHEADEGRLSGAGRSDKQRVSHVADMQVQTKRSRTIRRDVNKRWAIRREVLTRILAQPRPHRGDRPQ